MVLVLLELAVVFAVEQEVVFPLLPVKTFGDGRRRLGVKVDSPIAGTSCGCYFPFTYGGKTYNSCTSEDAGQEVEPWCAIGPLENRSSSGPGGGDEENDDGTEGIGVLNRYGDCSVVCPANQYPSYKLYQKNAKCCFDNCYSANTHSLTDLGNSLGAPSVGACAQHAMDDERCDNEGVFAYSKSGDCFCLRSGECDIENDEANWNIYCIGKSDNCLNVNKDSIKNPGKLSKLWVIVICVLLIIAVSLCYFYGLPYGDAPIAKPLFAGDMILNTQRSRTRSSGRRGAGHTPGRRKKNSLGSSSAATTSILTSDQFADDNSDASYILNSPASNRYQPMPSSG